MSQILLSMSHAFSAGKKLRADLSISILTDALQVQEQFKSLFILDYISGFLKI